MTEAVRPGGGPWPRAGFGDASTPRVAAGAQWASEAGLAGVPAAGEDLAREARRRARLGRPPLYVFGEVGSTADILRRLAEAGAPHGTLVVAERQRSGRGRHGRTWWAPPYGALLVSALLRDVASLGGLLPLFVGLAAAESCEAAGGDRLALKWPNDLVRADGRKVAGVLVERTGAGEALVGIGLNVVAPVASAPAEVAARAAGVAEGREPPPRDILLRHLAARLEGLGSEARARGPDVLLARWRARAPMLGRPVAVRMLDDVAPLAGVAAGIADDGALVVRLPDGREERVHAGEVTLAGAASSVAGPVGEEGHRSEGSACSI
jgi:BirA family biotin operon repressor/biotin-[acetyl-CoA-carboxylase] ligase